MYGLPFKYDSQQRCRRNPNARPSGKTPAGAPPEAPSSAYVCWLFRNSIETRSSAAKIGYFLRHTHVSFGPIPHKTVGSVEYFEGGLFKRLGAEGARRLHLRRQQLKNNQDFCLKNGSSQGQNLALTFFFVPNFARGLAPGAPHYGEGSL